MSDAGLISAITFDDVDAFAGAYDRHGDAVYGVARRLYEQHQAEETTRHVFLALWHSAEHFSEPDRALRAALLAEAHPRGVGFLRTEAAVHTGETNPLPTRRHVPPSRQGQRSGVCCPGLLEAEYRAITLAYFGGYTHQDIAALVERPKETVVADIRAGLRRFATASPDNHGSGQ